MDLRTLQKSLKAARDPELALAHLREALDREPTNPYVYNNFGWIYFAHFNNTVKAEYAFNKAIECDPNFATAHCNIGLLYGTRLNQPVRALQHFRTSLRLDPDNPDTHAWLATVLVGLQRWAEARMHFDRALEIDPVHRIASSRLARLLVDHDHSYPEAIALLQHVLDDDGNLPNIHYQLAKIYRDHTGDDGAALTHLRKTLELEPAHEEAAAELSAMLTATGDLAGAEVCLRDLVRSDPRSYSCRMRLADFLFHDAHDLIKAEKHYRIATKLTDKAAAAHNNVGVILATYFNMPDEAIASYKIAIDLDPDYGPAHHNLAVLYTELGDDSLARLHYVRALEISPFDSRIRLNLALLLRDKLNNVDGAMYHLRELLAHDPDHYSANVNLAALVMEIRHDADTAVKLLMTAVQSNPEDLVAHINLATIYHHSLHEYDNARREYLAALDADPLDTQVQVQLAQLNDTQYPGVEKAGLDHLHQALVAMHVTHTPTEALELSQRFAKTNQFSFLAQCIAAIIILELSRSKVRARAFIDRAAVIRPGAPVIQVLRERLAMLEAQAQRSTLQSAL